MKIRLLCVGKIKEKWLVDGIQMYSKRIKPFASLEIIEVPDSPDGDSAEVAKAAEEEMILKYISSTDFVVLSDLHGKEMDSLQFSNALIKSLESGGSKITFIIAGSNGFGKNIINRGNLKICLSQLTFTHQMTRLILLEQIYRAFKILNNHTYHK